MKAGNRPRKRLMLELAGTGGPRFGGPRPGGPNRFAYGFIMLRFFELSDPESSLTKNHN